MRLIDANKLYTDLANGLTCIMGDGTNRRDIDTYVMIGDIIREVIEKQPTAYDPDKVAGQLEELRQISASAKMERVIVYGGSLATYYGGEENAYEEAIKLVKGGVKNAD